MISRSRILLTGALALLFALACGDDDTVNPPPADTTPPTVTTVTPVDQYHVDVTFSEPLNESSAEDPSNYLVTETGTPFRALAASWERTPGDTILLASAVLEPDRKTVLLTTWDSMGGINCNLAIHGVSDANGNGMAAVDRLFAGSSDADVTPPEIVSRSPAPNATGVAVNAVILIQFSEPIGAHDFQLHTVVDVPLNEEQIDATTYRLMAMEYLTFDTAHTVEIDATDGHGNAMPHAQWTFTTRSMDDTPPTIVSTSPANNAVNVGVNTNLSITFSETINPNNFNATVLPDPGDGAATWSNEGKTVTFDPADPLLDNQQYVLSITPGDIFDTGGNSIAGVHTVVFSTGSALETGRISGTISGHPGSEASDPTGAIVLAVDFLAEGFHVLASTKVAANNTYTLSHLVDGEYYIFAELNTGSGVLVIEGGNAIGAYGVDFDMMDITPDSVVVADGAHVTGIDFSLYDPSAIEGTLTYSGSAEGSHTVYVGLFPAAGFDPQNPGDPAASTGCTWPAFPDWHISTLVQPVPMGNYYVGAFLDINGNQSYDLGQDPAGLYGGFTPTPIHIMDGNDIGGIVIPLQDPVPGVATATVTWPTPASSPLLQRLYEIARRGQSLAK